MQNPRKLHNKLLDNARRNIANSPSFPTKSSDSPKSTSLSPPKLLSSIPTFKKCDEKRKSFVGLLETNIDFTETNLDEFVRNKSLDKSLTISINDLSSCDIVENKNCDPRSPSKAFLRTPILITQKIGEVDFNTTLNECETAGEVPETVDCNSAESLLKLVDGNESIESEMCETENSQNNIVSEIITQNSGGNADILREVEKSQDIEVNEIDALISENIVEVCVIDDNNTAISEVKPLDASIEKNTEQKMAEIVDDLIGNICVLTTEETNIVVPYVDDIETKEPLIDITADVQEFDKKLTKIIQENNENFSFKKMITKDFINDNSKKRTPMKDRNQISEPKRNKLKVSDKPRKLNYEISKIPVFRDKNGIKSKVQCENTPPSDINIRRRKKSQPKWDTDKTLVI